MSNLCSVVVISFFLGVSCLKAVPVYADDNSPAPVNKANSDDVKDRELCILGKKVAGFPFYVYKDAKSDENNFIPTGNMGDFSSVGLNTHCSDSPYSGTTCIQIAYEPKEQSTYGWAGLYWQYPSNNWGNIPKAYDLTGAKRLTFWARGKEGGEVVNKFQVGGITGRYRDSGVASIGPVALSNKWEKYTIGLTGMDNSIIIGAEDKECWPFMEPLSRIIGGFCWATSEDANKGKAIEFYLDEIRFESD